MVGAGLLNSAGLFFLICGLCTSPLFKLRACHPEPVTRPKFDSHQGISLGLPWKQQQKGFSLLAQTTQKINRFSYKFHWITSAILHRTHSVSESLLQGQLEVILGQQYIE